MIIRYVMMLGIILSSQLQCMDDQSDLMLDFTNHFGHKSFTHAKETLKKIKIIPESNQLSILRDLVSHARDYSTSINFYNLLEATNKDDFIEIVSILVEKHRLSLNTVLPHNELCLPLAIIASAATVYGDVSMLEIFLKNGDNPDMQAVPPLSILETHALSLKEEEESPYARTISRYPRVLVLLEKYSKEYANSSSTIIARALDKLSKSREQLSKQ